MLMWYQMTKVALECSGQVAALEGLFESEQQRSRSEDLSERDKQMPGLPLDQRRHWFVYVFAAGWNKV